MNNENQYININRISAETHEQFDAFADGIMADAMRELSAPRQEVNLCASEQVAQILQRWQDTDVVDLKPGQLWSALDVAMATVLTVLKKRGMSIKALRQIRDGLNLPMYRDVLVLAFAVLLCRQEYHRGDPSYNAPYLVIDGENRMTLCRAADVPGVLTEPEIPTYSHIVLNMGRVLQECDFIYKITQSHFNELLELPAQIFERMFNSATKCVTVDSKLALIKTEIADGPDPEFGKRVICYANGRVVSDTVTTTERINE